VLRGPNHCSHCLCAPCVVDMPPDFLKGSCDAHPANAEKRHRLYRMFWRLLNDLCVWQDPEYLRRKERRTVRDDRRDILPPCIIQVILHNTCTCIMLVHTNYNLLIYTQEVRNRYPSHDGEYRDYMSTFDAERL